MITKLTVFFILLVTISIMAMLLYRRHNRYVANFALAMLISPAHRKAFCFVTVILALALHYNHYRAFGSCWGYILAVIVFMLLTRLSLVEKLIRCLSDSSIALYGFFIFTLGIMFIPQLFNVSIISLALLTAVSFYPSRVMRSKTEREAYKEFQEAKDKNDYGSFIDSYFQESSMDNRRGCEFNNKSAWESMCDFLSRRMRICNARLALFVRYLKRKRRSVYLAVSIMLSALLTYVSDIRLCI